MSPQNQKEIVAARKRFEAEMEGEIDSLEATQNRARKTTGFSQLPQNAVQGKRTQGSCARYGRCSVWNRRTRVKLKVQ